VCFEVARRIKENPELLTGIVDIYPAMNPLGIDSMTRGIPGFDLDMNRIFPGSKMGAMTEYVAYKIIEDLAGSDLCVDIHASNIFLTEIPQIRINELHKDKLVPMAKEMNVDFVWIHGASTVLESTLAYSLNSTGTPTLVVEMGVGMRITKGYCEQLVDGIFNTMKKMGIWQGEVKSVREPIVADEASGVVFYNAPKAGIFIPTAKHWEMLEVGEEVGRIVDPLRGEVLSTIISEDRGILFTIREYPVVDEGSLIGRLLKC
jgi:predicted deacylase